MTRNTWDIETDRVVCDDPWSLRFLAHAASRRYSAPSRAYS